MDTHQDHKITVCTSCKRKGTQQRPGYELIEKLRGAIRAADDAATTPGTMCVFRDSGSGFRDSGSFLRDSGSGCVSLRAVEGLEMGN